jgi:hypothetical protein
MKQSAEEECYQLGHLLACSILDYAFQIHMSVEEIVHRFVPKPVELFKGGTVPPFVIELSICIQSDFSKDVGNILKYNIEEKNEQNSNRKHASHN